MDLKEWRETRRVVLRLDGLELHFRRVSLINMAIAGEIPAPLAGLVQEMIDTPPQGTSIDAWTAFAPLIDHVLTTTSMGEVVVTEQPSEETLGVGEIPFTAKVRVFNAMTSPGGELAPFRAESKTAMEAA